MAKKTIKRPAGPFRRPGRQGDRLRPLIDHLEHMRHFFFLLLMGTPAPCDDLTLAIAELEKLSAAERVKPAPTAPAPAPPDPRKMVNENTAAELLGISPRTLQAWRVAGTGPKFFKIGRTVRYRPAELDSYVRRRIRNAGR
jgi:predicted DNA-binding transcriptional regulator AlpA